MPSSGTFIDFNIFYLLLTGVISERNGTCCMPTETHETHYKEEVIEVGAERFFIKKDLQNWNSVLCFLAPGGSFVFRPYFWKVVLVMLSHPRPVPD